MKATLRCVACGTRFERDPYPLPYGPDYEYAGVCDACKADKTVKVVKYP